MQVYKSILTTHDVESEASPRVGATLIANFQNMLASRLFCIHFTIDRGRKCWALNGWLKSTLLTQADAAFSGPRPDRIDRHFLTRIRRAAAQGGEVERPIRATRTRAPIEGSEHGNYSVSCHPFLLSCAYQCLLYRFESLGRV